MAVETEGDGGSGEREVAGLFRKFCKVFIFQDLKFVFAASRSVLAIMIFFVFLLCAITSSKLHVYYSILIILILF